MSIEDEKFLQRKFDEVTDADENGPYLNVLHERTTMTIEGNTHIFQLFKRACEYRSIGGDSKALWLHFNNALLDYSEVVLPPETFRLFYFLEAEKIRLRQLEESKSDASQPNNLDSEPE